jgi:uncharacterized protein YdaU (DUF1376 family)
VRGIGEELNHMKKPPAFQFYADDFVSGVSDMTQSEVGAYILLLCRQWCAGEIPADPDRLRLIAKGEVSSHVAAKFVNGKNQRMEQVRAQREEWVEKCRIGGKHSAQVKGSSTTLATTLGSKGQLKGQVNGNTPTPTPTPSPLIEDKTNGLRPIAFNGRLSPMQAEVAERFIKALGKQWDNGNGCKWMKRCRDYRIKSERVVAEVENAIKEQRISTTPAQYAEQIWKEFN